MLSGGTGANDPLYRKLLDGLLGKASSLNRKSLNNGFLISLSPEDYRWGSNMDVLHNAMILLIAHRFTGDAALDVCGLDHLQYVLGRNVMNMSYVTGFGANPVKHPHHRPSIPDSAADPVPGLVAGGPNRGLQDDCAREHLTGAALAACFIDDQESYSTNEVTIYWNSPAVFVASYFAAKENRVKL